MGGIESLLLVLADRTANQCRHLLKDEMMCWTFLKDSAIPLTNNLAERAIRPYVIWRKLSFASQSYQGDQFRPMILTILGTTQKLGDICYKLVIFFAGFFINDVIAVKCICPLNNVYFWREIIL